MAVATITKEIGLLFTPENREKAIAGLKTQTRRVMKPYPITFHSRTSDEILHVQWGKYRTPYDHDLVLEDFFEFAVRNCPYGKEGDRLYLLEPTQVLEIRSGYGLVGNTAIVQYRDGETIEQRLTSSDSDRLNARKDWKKEATSRFMLKSFARHWFRIDGIRVEQLQNISEEDAISEGIIQLPSGYWSGGTHAIKGTTKCLPDPVSGFRDLWDSINLKSGHGWDKNDWVWVVSFSTLLSGKSSRTPD